MLKRVWQTQSCRYIYRNYSKNVEINHPYRKWKSVVGLEVHAQISATSKLFSSASTAFSSPVNSEVSLIDCAVPGMLPVPNKRCIEAGVLTALALNCKINPVSMFDRKHYFYADMPAGFQITQQRSPLASSGVLNFQVYVPGFHKTPYEKMVRIKQLQLEQDSGKSLHDDDRSLIDLNRSGSGLIEVVFEPDLNDGEEAAALVKELASILLKIGTCSCRMEEGALRVDANVSIHQDEEPYGVRTEIKNIGSVRGVAGAVRYEIERQIKLRESGESVINETRAWDAVSKTTTAMRDKQVQQDYRYMPEPNLPPLHLAMGSIEHGSVNVDELRLSLPELPAQTRLRLQTNFGLSAELSIILVNENALLEIFEEESIKEGIDHQLLAKVLIYDLVTLLNKFNLDISNFANQGQFIRETVMLLQKGNINRNTCKELLKHLLEGTDLEPMQIIKKFNMVQISKESDLQQLCQDVLQENEKIVILYKSGNHKVFKALMGKIARKTKQTADMNKCSIILKQLLQ